MIYPRRSFFAIPAVLPAGKIRQRLSRQAMLSPPPFLVPSCPAAIHIKKAKFTCIDDNTSISSSMFRETSFKMRYIIIFF
jgi:hypothetical protein